MISFSIILVFFYTFTSFPPIQTPTNFVQQEPFFANIEIDTSGETNKIGKSGKSLSTQSGKYISENNSELILTKVGLNIDNSTKYDIILKVFKEEELISADSLNYIPENH